MVKIANHPLITLKLGIIRNKETSIQDFRQAVTEVGSYLGYLATENITLKEKPINTPVAKTIGHSLYKPILVVSILRAGLGLVDGILQSIPGAHLATIAISRDEKTLQPTVFYQKFPKHLERYQIILVDPMLATGGSASLALTRLKEGGATDLTYIGLIGVKEGVALIEANHPDTEIVLGCLDPILNEVGYIIPGLGDCGDRLFGDLDD